MGPCCRVAAFYGGRIFFIETFDPYIQAKKAA